jgi:hypothetical protein
MNMAVESRALVVDDEPQITRVLRTVLTSQDTKERRLRRVGATRICGVAAGAGHH